MRRATSRQNSKVAVRSAAFARRQPKRSFQRNGSSTSVDST